MSFYGDVKKRAADPLGEAKVTARAPIDEVVKRTGSNWNPADTALDELHAPGSGIKNAATATGGSISNAYHTSVLDPVNKVGDRLSDAWNHINDMWGHANKNVMAPGGLPTINVPQVGGVGAPGGPGGGSAGGSPGGAPSVQIAAKPVMVNGVAAGTVAAPGPNDAFRNAQTGLVNQLALQAQGKGPSVAGAQLQQGQQANLAATMAQLASARGGANPLLQRQTMQTSADIQAKTNQDAAMARLQEQMNAQGMLGQVAGAGRSGDIATGQLGLQGQQVGLQGMDLSLKEQGMNQQAAQMQNELAAKYAGMGMDAQKANQQAAIEIAQLQQQGVLGLGALQMQSGAAQNALLGQALGAGAGAISYMASDARLKEDVKPADAKLDSFLSALGAHDYKYKDEKWGKGRYVGPMAQDLQRSEIGRSMVIDTPEGKMVGFGPRTIGTVLSAQALLLKRVKELENKKGKK